MLGAKQVQRQQLCRGGPRAGDAAGHPAAVALNITGNCPLCRDTRLHPSKDRKPWVAFLHVTHTGCQCIQLANIREESLYEFNVCRICYCGFDLHPASGEHQKLNISAQRNIGQRINLH